MNIRPTQIFFFISIIFFSSVCNAVVWKVGPAKIYSLPSQIANLVADGDVIEIDSAEYVDCASWNANNLTIKGVGGRPHIKNKVCGGKGIWNLNGLNTTIENIEFSGADNPDRNGAGIRGTGGGFTVRNCYFHHNNNGILASPSVSISSKPEIVLIEYSEFFQNGYGDGYSHNLYIGNFQQFTLQFCYVHGAKIGHEVKSRAFNNFILYNKITNDESDASYSIDISNGGNSFLIGNVIEKGVNSLQTNLIAYGLEGFHTNTSNNLFLINNTLVNNRRNSGNFIKIQPGTATLKLVNNIFAGIGTVLNGTAATLDSAKNLTRTNIATFGFKNPAVSEYELTSTSPAINNGINPGNFGVFSLSAVSEYLHPASGSDRLSNGTIDIGSYEYKPASLSLFKEKGSQLFAQIFPNPFQDAFTLRILKSAEKITVTNIYGKEVFTLIDPEEVNYIKIGDELFQGIYIVTTYFHSGLSESTRIVKMK